MFQLGYFVCFLCFEPSKAIRLDFLFFCARESILVYFGVCVVSFYFLRFSSLKRFRGLLLLLCWRSFLVDVGCSICVASFYFLHFCHLHPDFACWSSPRVGVGVGPNSLNLGLGLGFNPKPNPGLRGWSGVSPDSGTRGWGWG